jgi:hypothetical protein
MQGNVMLAAATLVAVGVASIAAREGAKTAPDPAAGVESSMARVVRQDTTRASISFSRQVPDAQVVQLARRHGVRITAVKLWAEGFGGTHRLRTAGDADSTVRGARGEAIGFFTRANRSKTRRIQRVLERFPRERFLTDTVAQRAARSLIDFDDRVKRGAAAARAGAAFIYGIEVEGPAERVEALRSDPLTARLERAVDARGTRRVPSPGRPAELRRPASISTRLTPAQLYDRLVALSREG